MTLPRKYRSGALAANISLLLLMTVVASSLAADHLEIQVRLNSIFRSPARTNEYNVTATCILGTNDWYISGQFAENANHEYWLKGTKVFERQTITSSMYVKQAKDYISEKLGTKPPPPFLGISYPHKGEIRTRTNSWLEPFGYGVERSVWLALCSGNFLHTTDREIPLLIGPRSQAQGYRDETVFLQENSNLSLPKTVDLFRPDGALASHYEVLVSTNVLGNTLPLQFLLTQYGNPGQPAGANTIRYILRGSVLSIKPSEGPPAFDIKPAP
jgi:hypothetical protein